MPTPTEASAPLDPRARRTLGLLFLTVFLDLVGFSIIFPLFPGMLSYYAESATPGSLFSLLYAGLEQFSAIAQSPSGEWGIIVLFGGVLGSLYSLLQFGFAPLWGRASDHFGRRPILLLTIAGLAMSYALWIVAAPFVLLLLARLLGGVMSGNLSTATAVVADVTPPQQRGRGMAVIGIAFGVGFIVGPAIGGAAALIDLTAWWPALEAYGVHPFSAPAAVALVLSAVNWVLVARYLPETRQPHSGSETARTANPLALFSGPPHVARTNAVYFLFLLAFSGMEFSLTFLAAERLDFAPHHNAFIFVFVGLILAGVQGTYVRRYADLIGAKAMALQGMATVLPGLALIGLSAYAQSVPLLFIGLAFLGVGAAQATPCLTTLASIYAPPSEQGRALGLFRSVGALGRAVGPLIACVIYWRLGSVATYFVATLFLVVPLWLLWRLPAPRTEPAPAA